VSIVLAKIIPTCPVKNEFLATNCPKFKPACTLNDYGFNVLG
jgi:hypothetical protein